MKKVTYFLLFLSINFFFLCFLSGKTVNAQGWYKAIYEDSSIYESGYNCNLENTVENYFSKLTYYPNNRNGCCGYVAMTMLLSYYNFIFDDAFIDSKFENRPTVDSDNYNNLASPGTYGVSNYRYFGSTKNMTKQQFYNGFYSDNPNCFMAYLYNFAYRNVSETDYAWNSKDSATGERRAYQTNGIIVHDTLKKYLLEIDSQLAGSYILCSEDLEVKLNNHGDWKSFEEITNAINNYASHYLKRVKSLIDAGYPVLVGGYRPSREGHMAIAYAYEDDKLIVNDGNGNVSINFLGTFPYITAYYAIIPYSKNNIVNRAASIYYSTQEKNIYHWQLKSHSHYFYLFQKQTSFTHSAKCYCDIWMTCQHTLTLLGGNTYLCKECGFTTTLNNNDETENNNVILKLLGDYQSQYLEDKKNNFGV